jgi:hypothetical protein
MSALATTPWLSRVDAAQAGTETTVDLLLNPPVSWLATIVSDDTEIQSQWTSISP